MKRWMPKSLSLALLVCCAYGLPVFAADGVIDLPGAKFVGPSLHDVKIRITQHTVFISGQVNDGAMLVIRGQNAEGHQIKISIFDPVGKLKTPHSYKIVNNLNPDDSGDGVYAIIEYEGAFECGSRGGTLKLTAMGGVAGPIAGSLEGVKWSTDDDKCSSLGSTGSFRLQRAMDRR